VPWLKLVFIAVVLPNTTSQSNTAFATFKTIKMMDQQEKLSEKEAGNCISLQRFTSCAEEYKNSTCSLSVRSAHLSSYCRAFASSAFSFVISLVIPTTWKPLRMKDFATQAPCCPVTPNTAILGVLVIRAVEYGPTVCPLRAEKCVRTCCILN
jgi:hypothetical protein